MKMNNNIVLNGTNNAKATSQTHKNRLFVCSACGEPIDQLYKNEYICKECYNARHQGYTKKWLQKFDGLYLYEWQENTVKNPLYLGFTTNFEKRHGNHKSGDTAFSRYIHENDLNFADHTMYILDLTPYKDSITVDDALLLEHFNIASANLDYDILNNKDTEWDFTEQELERIEYLHELVDMRNYIAYNELKHKKNKLSELSNTDNL